MTMKKQFFAALVLLPVLCTAVFAAEYEIKERTPEIHQAFQNRHARFEELRQFKAAGELGESNQGYVEPLKGSSPEAAALAKAENADRFTIYKAIAEQNHLGKDGLKTVQKAFAEVRRDRARQGDYIQIHSGEWLQKF